MLRVYDALDIYICFGWWKVRSRSCLTDSEGEWESKLMELEGEAAKQLDIINDSNKMEAVVMAAARNGLGGGGGNEMTAMAATQAWLVIRWRKKRENIVIRRRQQ